MAGGDIQQIQICDNLSVSAALSQLPWKGHQGAKKTRLLGSSRGGHYIIMYQALTVPSGLKTGSLPR